MALANGGAEARRTADTVPEPRPATRVLTTPVPPRRRHAARGPDDRAAARRSSSGSRSGTRGCCVPPKVPLSERLRRGTAVGCGGVALGAATTVAPYVTGVAVLLGVWLLRTGSLAASAGADRRTTRGSKWYDAPQFAVTTPWHSLRAITGTVVLAALEPGSRPRGRAALLRRGARRRGHPVRRRHRARGRAVVGARCQPVPVAARADRPPALRQLGGAGWRCAACCFSSQPCSAWSSPARASAGCRRPARRSGSEIPDGRVVADWRRAPHRHHH